MNTDRIVRVPPIDPAVSFVLLQGLSGLGSMPATQQHWDNRVVRLLRAHRLAPLALRAIDHYGITVAVGDRAVLTQSATRRIGTTMAVLRGMRTTQDLLNASGIPSLGIKGVAMSDVDLVATRCFGDADLIVPEADFLHALVVLASAGATHELQAFSNRRIQRTWPATNVSDGRLVEADIHRRIAPSVWTRSFGYEEMLVGARTGTEPGTRVVGHCVNLVIIAASIVGDLGTPHAKIHAWRDLAILARKCEPAEIRAVAEPAGLAWVVAETLRALDRDLPGQLVPDALLDEFPERCSARHHVRLRLMTSRAGTNSLSSMMRWPATAAASYGLVVAFPPRGTPYAEGLNRRRDWLIRAVRAPAEAAATGALRRMLPSEGASSNRLGRAIQALLLREFVRSSLSRRGIRRTDDVLSTFAVTQTPKTAPEFDRLAQSVARWAVQRPGPVTCLPRAMMLRGALISRGHDAHVEIGADRTNLKAPAHAWVEVNGRPVFEPDDPHKTHIGFDRQQAVATAS